MINEERLVKHKGRIYTTELYRAEQQIAVKIRKLMDASVTAGEPHFDGLMDDQVEALKKMVQSPVFILTGAPGTGKTHLAKQIIEAFQGADIALCAPTGKASRRLSEQTGKSAQTIHKLLEPQPHGKQYIFSRDKNNPLEKDLILIDEMSMVDTKLFSSLLDAVQVGTRLILIGDVHQLPSVGPGNILKDLIDSGQVASQELNIIKRQDEGLIIRNCHNIKNGKNIVIDNESSNDFFFMQRDSVTDIQKTVIDIVVSRLPESYDVDPLKDIQVIPPLREKTMLSCDSRFCFNPSNTNEKSVILLSMACL